MALGDYRASAVCNCTLPSMGMICERCRRETQWDDWQHIPWWMSYPSPYTITISTTTTTTAPVRRVDDEEPRSSWTS